MNRLNRLTVAVIATSLLAVPSVYASTVNVSSPIHAFFGKQKSTTVKINLRNDTGSSMDVKVGDTLMTLAPGKPVSVNLPVGTRIVATTATANYQAGSVIEEVISSHDGATIVIR
jgi:hypothetical protein